MQIIKDDKLTAEREVWIQQILFANGSNDRRKTFRVVTVSRRRHRVLLQTAATKQTLISALRVREAERYRRPVRGDVLQQHL